MSTPNVLVRWDAALHAERASHPIERPEDPHMAQLYDTVEFHAPSRGSALRWAARQAVILSGGSLPSHVRRAEALERQATRLDDKFDMVLNNANHYVDLYAGSNPFGWKNVKLFKESCRQHDYRVETDNGIVTVTPASRRAHITHEDGTGYRLQQHQLNTTGENPTTWTDVAVTLADGSEQQLHHMPPATAIEYARDATETLATVGSMAEVIKAQLQEVGL